MNEFHCLTTRSAYFVFVKFGGNVIISLKENSMKMLQTKEKNKKVKLLKIFPEIIKKNDRNFTT